MTPESDLTGPRVTGRAVPLTSDVFAALVLQCLAEQPGPRALPATVVSLTSGKFVLGYVFTFQCPKIEPRTGTGVADSSRGR